MTSANNVNMARASTSPYTVNVDSGQRMRKSQLIEQYIKTHPTLTGRELIELIKNHGWSNIGEFAIKRWFKKPTYSPRVGNVQNMKSEEEKNQIIKSFIEKHPGHSPYFIYNKIRAFGIKNISRGVVYGYFDKYVNGYTGLSSTKTEKQQSDSKVNTVNETQTVPEPNTSDGDDTDLGSTVNDVVEVGTWLLNNIGYDRSVSMLEKLNNFKLNNS